MAKKEFKNKKTELDLAIEEAVHDNETEKTEEKEDIRKKWPLEEVIMVDDTHLLVGKRKYRLVYNHREGFDLEKLRLRFSDILSRYDYIVGDWGYEQLRLRGFYNSDHKKAQSEQKINTLVDYLYESCNFGCSFFVLERLGGNHDHRVPDIYADEDEKPKKKRKRRRRNKNKNAYIEEKKAPVVEQKKPVKKHKPVIHDKKNSSANTNAQNKPRQNRNNENSNRKPAENKKRSFTIRTKETAK
jgi:uncharacterized protein YutD